MFKKQGKVQKLVQCFKYFFNGKQHSKKSKAAKIIGRDSQRWRLDAIGNIVFRPLNSCTGPLCYTYDHIFPFSKGGKTEVNNCQILQTNLNAIKSNKINVSYGELKTISPQFQFTNEELNIIEKAGYGNLIIPTQNAEK